MELTEMNEAQSRKRLYNVDRRMRNDEKLQAEFSEIAESQLRDGVIEKVPSDPSSSWIFWMPHKPVLGLPMKWKFCPSSENASDLGSHWASIVESK